MPYFTTTPSFSAFSFGQVPPSKPLRRTVVDWAGRETSRFLLGTDGISHFTTSTAYSLWDTTETNPRGHQKLYRQNAQGEVAYIEEREGSSLRAATNFTWDLLGNLTEVADNSDNRTKMWFDNRGLKLRMEDPDSSNCPGGPANCPWLYSYDSAGRLVSQQDAAGQQITYSNDELGRPFKKDYSCASPCAPDVDVDLAYDETANGLGQLTSVKRGTGGTNDMTFVHDNWGRVTGVTRAVQSSLLTTTHAFDNLGRVTSITYPGTGEVASYGYGTGGAVETVSFAGRSIITGMTYDALSRPLQVNWGNGLVTDNLFKTNQKIDSINVGNSGSTLLHFEYEYDAAGNTTDIFEDADGWWRAFQYDWADRLTNAAHHVGQNVTSWNWSYSPIGNMTFNSDWVIPGVSDGSYQYGIGAGPHALTKIGGAASSYTLTYDKNGALTNEGTGWKYAYNFDGNTRSLVDTIDGYPSVEFEYDGHGSRVRKSWVDSDFVSRELRYFGPHFEELREDAVLTQLRYVLLGETRVAMVTSRAPSKTYFLHPDVQGTVGITTDETGALVERQVFAPYGGGFSQSGNTPDLRYGYTGQEHDSEANQIHLGVRQYHFAIGRFPVPDSVVPDPLRPQTLNRYSYGFNNPIRYTDPSGYSPPQSDCSNVLESRQCNDGTPAHGDAWNSVVITESYLTGVAEGTAEILETSALVVGAPLLKAAMDAGDAPAFFQDYVTFIALPIPSAAAEMWDFANSSDKARTLGRATPQAALLLAGARAGRPAAAARPAAAPEPEAAPQHAPGTFARAYLRRAVREQVFNQAPPGETPDTRSCPTCGGQMSLDPRRNLAFDHFPVTFRELVRRAMRDPLMTRRRFIDLNNDPNNLRAQCPECNSSHAFEPPGQ